MNADDNRGVAEGAIIPLLAECATPAEAAAATLRAMTLAMAERDDPLEWVALVHAWSARLETFMEAT